MFYMVPVLSLDMLEYFIIIFPIDMIVFLLSAVCYLLEIFKRVSS